MGRPCASTRTSPRPADADDVLRALLARDIGLMWQKRTDAAQPMLFALMGVLVFWICFVVIDKLTPYDLWAEIIEKKNVALAIVVGSMCIAIGLIVSAAVHG